MLIFGGLFESATLLPLLVLPFAEDLLSSVLFPLEIVAGCIWSKRGVIPHDFRYSADPVIGHRPVLCPSGAPEQRVELLPSWERLHHHDVKTVYI